MYHSIHFNMNTERKRGGRIPKLNPKSHHVMLRFDDDEWMKFLVMYEQTDVKAKAVFAKARIFGEPFKVLRGAIETFGLVRRLRPDVVISAGAAPGLLCLLWGRVFGAKTIWIDSIANAETLSLSGKIALHFAHRVLTQWDHLARPGKVEHWGSVL